MIYTFACIGVFLSILFSTFFGYQFCRKHVVRAFYGLVFILILNGLLFVVMRNSPPQDFHHLHLFYLEDGTTKSNTFSILFWYNVSFNLSLVFLAMHRSANLETRPRNYRQLKQL